MLLLVNGVRLNDNLYDQANIGTNFPIDLGTRSSGWSLISSRARRCTGPTPSLAWSTSSRATGASCPGPKCRWKRQPRQCQGAPVGGHRGCPTAATGWWQPRATRRGADLPQATTPQQQQPRRGPGLDFDRSTQLFARMRRDGLALTPRMPRRHRAMPTAAFSGCWRPALPSSPTRAPAWRPEHRAVSPTLAFTGRAHAALPPRRRLCVSTTHRSPSTATWVPGNGGAVNCSG